MRGSRRAALAWGCAAGAAAVAGCQPRMPLVAAPLPEPAVYAPAVEEPMPERAGRLFEEGVSLGRQSRWEEAADRYRLAAAADPTDSRYPLALADALVALGRDGDAADALAAAIRIDEAASPVNHRVLYVDYERLVRLLTRAGRLDEARTARDRQEHHRMMRDAGS